MGGAGKALVAPAARAAAGHHGALAAANEVIAGAVGLDEHLGAGRHGQLERRPVGAVAQRALSVAAAAGLEVRAAPERLQIAQRVRAHQHDVAAAAAVAAVGTALGHVGLAAEAEGSVAPAAGLNVDSRAIVHAVSLSL